MTIETIVPVRPGAVDRFPVYHPQVTTRVIECSDGQLSQVWKQAYAESKADILLWKHDDFRIQHPEDFIASLVSLMDRYPAVGVAGARSYAPNRNPAWWQQAPLRAGYVDGVCRGMVSHPAQGDVARIGPYFPVFYGPPGPAVVLDGCCVAVRQPRGGDPSIEEILACWDLEFKEHFYDVAFTLNLTRLFQARLQNACYVMVADVIHESGGNVQGEAWPAAAKRMAEKYRMPAPCMAI